MNSLLVICGPTATGKTDVAVALAGKLNGELVSADSRQVYIGMDIGTGKDKQKLSGAKVWMYDYVNPDEPFSVALYREGALKAINDIWSRGKLPVVVGGTGFYIDALLHPQQSFSVKPDQDLRNHYAAFTLKQLQDTLQACDPGIFESMNNSDRNNPRRLIRKIELASTAVTAATGRNSVRISRLKMIGLKAPLDELNSRIESRVDARMAEGIAGEIAMLLSKGYSWDLPSMSGLGYKQWKEYFEGTATMSAVVEKWKRDERKYAKRQITWFKKYPEIEWYDIVESGFLKQVTASVLSWYTKDGK